MSKLSCILTADWHLRLDRPKCRTDDYMEAQRMAVEFVKKAAVGNPIIFVGDLFHHWKPSPELLSWAITYIPGCYVIPGQHDLPDNNIAMIHRSGLNTLSLARRGDACPLHLLNASCYHKRDNWYIKAFPFGVEPRNTRRRRADRMIAMCHTLVWHKEAPPGHDKGSALKLLRKLEGYDLVVVGDNHKPFIVEDKGRLLVSPGSLMRMTADQIDHQPRVYGWNAEDNTVEPYFLPIEEGVISRDHLNKVEERDTRIDAFVARLKDNWEVGLSFDKNMEAFFVENRVRKEVKAKIWEAMGNE